jgi:tellurite resistance protein TerC
VLAFVGIKMLVAGVYEVPVLLSLAVIVTLLALSIVASVLLPPGPGAIQAQCSSDS